MKKNYLLVSALIIAMSAGAQDTTGTITRFMEKVQQAYRQASCLDFHVLYRYANQNQPGNFIDSLQGELAMDKNRLRFVIDDVETITTGDYTIRIMKEEKLIYLEKTSRAAMTDPVNMLHSVMAQVKGVQATIVRSHGLATLQIVFPPGQLYKNISMTVNESTGYFQKVVYELYTENWVGYDLVEEPGKPAPYQPEGRVEIIFSHYRQGHINESLFNAELYITRLGAGRFEPSAQYKDYRIFLASSTL